MKLASYIFLFIAAGLIAVGAKWLGRSSFFLAGVFIMFPINTLFNMALISATDGSKAVREMLPGAVIGVVGIATFLLAVWITQDRMRQPGPLIVGTLVWLATCYLGKALTT